MRFRLHEVAYMASRRHFCRNHCQSEIGMLLDFCGLQAGQQEVVEKLRELRMTTMVSGASPSPILLTATIRKHLKQHESEYHEVVEMIRTSLYGEDFIASSRSIRGTCSDNYSKGSHVHSCMDLCEWMMNSPKLKEKGKESSTEGSRLSVETSNPQHPKGEGEHQEKLSAISNSNF